jgi:uncharacterized protein (TIGR02722 family)
MKSVTSLLSYMRLPGLLLILLGFLITLIGCAGKVRYGDAQQQETLTVDFGSTDLQLIAEKMVNSMLRIPLFERGERPVVFVSSVKNKTMEHIDTKSITDKIRTTLIQSGKVRFTATSDIPNEILDQLEYQRGSGLVDPRTRKEYGKQIGADYILYGEIGSIVKRAGRSTDVYYKITLNLADIQTGLIEWADEKEIRKTEKKPILGL